MLTETEKWEIKKETIIELHEEKGFEPVKFSHLDSNHKNIYEVCGSLEASHVRHKETGKMFQWKSSSAISNYWLKGQV